MSKAKLAATAVTGNPQMSDRAIAAEIGVSGETVRQARKQLPSDLAVDDEPRTGLDGKRPLMSKAQRVREYDAANPGKSTREVAEDLGDGINAMDVSRSRRNSPVTSVTPDVVTGSKVSQMGHLKP